MLPSVLRRSRTLLAFAFVVVAACNTARDSRSIALSGATVIDAHGGARLDQVVLIRNGRIVEVRPRAQGVVPGEFRIVDVSGKYILPGLIDSHAHLGADRGAIEAYLRFLFLGGITAVRDMGSDSFLFSQMTAKTQDPSVALSRVYYSATWAGASFWDDRRWVGSTQGKPPGSLAWARMIDESSDLAAAATAARDIGVTGIKVYSDLSPDIVGRIPAAAHGHGLRVWSHPVVFPTKPSQVVRAGVDVISHASLFVWEGATAVPPTYHHGRFSDFGPPAPFADVPVDSPAIIAVLEEMKRRGTLLDATVSAVPLAVSREAAAWAYELTARARRMGIGIVAGTDRDVLKTDDGYPTLFEELEALVEKCGLSPLDAITAATLNAARALGTEREFGTIETGRFADLIVVDANPLDDIRNLRRVSLVVKNGDVHPPAGRSFS